MDIPDVVSVRKFNEFNQRQKDELYETLLELNETLAEIPKKSLRKTLELTLAVLEYKGEEANRLQEQLDAKSQAFGQDESLNERLMDENDKLKRMLEKLEDEKLQLKNKVKELTDEIFQLQKRLQDAANSAENSDKDSSDPLSELDKQEELLRNINTKNKHIKRLLREIETLQTQNIEQSKTIIEIEKDLQQAKVKMLQMSADITLVDSERKALTESVNELNIEISRLEGNITYLEEEREKSERELKDFIEKLEVKAQSWKNMIDAKETELKKLRGKLQREGGASRLTPDISKSEESSVKDEEENALQETTKLLHAIESRDKLIEQLEEKIKVMADEMLTSTKLMNKLTAEKEEERNPQKPRPCCKLTEEALQAANERCRELSEMLERSEEDNTLKAKQAMQAITALEAYQSGEDGLVKALRKCTSLEQKIVSRDKQIRALVMELNSMHEISYENSILRKRLHIPDDVVISAKNLAAKERSKDKIIDRLTLKLRASEEMRLQLKLEKSDMRKELLKLENRKPEAQETLMSLETASSEIGEVVDSLRIPTAPAALDEHISNCKENKMLDLQNKYQEVLDENEILRIGMQEILEKLREYDACSDHITIDTEILLRLLQSIQTRSSSDTPKRLHSELQTLKEREVALRDLLERTIPMPPVFTLPLPQNDIETDELPSIDSMRENSELHRNSIDETVLELPTFIDTSTRPTTPNKALVNSINIPVIEPDIESSAIRCDLETKINELQIYRKHYEELKIHMTASENELHRYCGDLVEQVTRLEVEVGKQNCKYSYMHDELDRILTTAKQAEMQHIQEVSELKINLVQQQAENSDEQCKQLTNNFHLREDDYLALQKTNVILQAQLAHFVGKTLEDKELKVPDICLDYGIIKDNLEVNFITLEEYEQQQNKLQIAMEQQEDKLRQIKQLESLLEIAQEQIQSQQRLLNEITDNHINLRHLVADLQSTSEEKHLLAKMQRDLDSAKSELENLKIEHNKLQQNYETLQAELNAKQKDEVQLKKDFQNERKNKNIKIIFLQKTLYNLKQKYCKFTPLIFLTNFVFAYKKFVKKSIELEETTSRNSEVSKQVEEIVISKVKERNDSLDEAEQFIKLIKHETQYKLLEESYAQSQKKCVELQLELTEQRLHYASESEHWQTIEALFGEDKMKLKLDTKTEADMNLTQAKDAGTNTETAPPIPADRKSANKTSNKQTELEMIDKNMSPIGTPVKQRQTELREVNTQTSDELLSIETSTKEMTSSKNITKEQINESLSPEAEYSTNTENKDFIMDKSLVVSTTDIKESNNAAQATDQYLKDSERKQTNEVLVQTCATKVENQAAQTIEAEKLKLSEGDNPIEVQLQEALSKSADREQQLMRLQAELAEAMERIAGLEKCLTAEKLPEKSAPSSSSEEKPLHQQELRQHTGIIEKTILSFHTLLIEKDKSISKYQDLLQGEREQVKQITIQLNVSIEGLQKTINDLNGNIKSKDMEILELKTKLETVGIRRNSAEKLDIAMVGGGGGASAVTADEDGIDNSLNELTDEKIEEMFQQDIAPISAPTKHTDTHGLLEKQDTECLKETSTLLKQIKELKDKASYREKTIQMKEDEIMLLKEKVQLYQEREKSLISTTKPEMGQFQTLLEEKDKHINDLMETLNNFHDDQQRYINDSSSDTADQISKLSTDLTRVEATNKIYQTQVEALRRQVNNLTQREKQTREMNQSLRNQLIKRPVVSIKTELNARVKAEHLQKRIQQLELDLEDAKAQIKRQQAIIDSKRARSATEVGMWEKQKRWQQSAEKYKTKCEETESMLEKTRSLLQSARNTINRLEKEKHVMDAKLGRATHGHNSNNASTAQIMKCCRTPSCPNLLHHSGAKYTPSDSPETYTGASSECSSPAHRGQSIISHSCQFYCMANSQQPLRPQDDLVEALKARIELQQRKIIAMELEGKGTNTLTTELEKLQEKLSAVEAQNIRLEAKNLQLQLDNDLLRQGDGTERLQKRIKHLEDYIIALKEEIAIAATRRDLCKCSGHKLSTQQGHSAEQTILSLRNIVEKLRAENKYLKDGRRSCESRNSIETPTDFTRLQQMYAESLDKISALQIELNVKTKCAYCGTRGKLDTHAMNDEVKSIKEQLIKKTHLLQKAKVLLTRAAAKEKVLKEQLALWKRKCSELQNVPVIDEISE